MEALPMKINVRIGARVLYCAICLIFLGGFGFAAAPNPAQITAGQKTKVKGTIASRNGDIVNVKDAKTGSRVAVMITDGTKIERPARARTASNASL